MFARNPLADPKQKAEIAMLTYDKSMSCRVGAGSLYFTHRSLQARSYSASSMLLDLRVGRGQRFR